MTIHETVAWIRGSAVVAVREVVAASPLPPVSGDLTLETAIEDGWTRLTAARAVCAARLPDLILEDLDCGSFPGDVALRPGHHRWRDLHLTAAALCSGDDAARLDHLDDLEAHWAGIQAEARVRSRELEEMLGGRSRPVALPRPAVDPVIWSDRLLAA